MKFGIEISLHRKDLNQNIFLSLTEFTYPKIGGSNIYCYWSWHYELVPFFHKFSDLVLSERVGARQNTDRLVSNFLFSPTPVTRIGF